MSDKGIGLCPEPGTDTAAAAGPFFPVATVSSTIVFHSPHAGHLPIHFGLSFPHSLQNHTVFVFTVAITSYIISTNLYKKRYCSTFRGTISHRTAGAVIVNQTKITQPCCSLRMCCRTVRTLLSRSTQLRSMNLPSRKPGRSPRTQCTLLPSLNCCCMRMKQQRTWQQLLPMT